MKIKFATYWDDANTSVAMTAYNIGILRVAAETENIMYILSKINDLYQSVKKRGDVGIVDATQSKLLIDDVIYKLLRLGHHESDFNEWPSIYGPRADGYIPDIRNIKIERVHLVKALTPIRGL